jgi:hypothetical protein
MNNIMYIQITEECIEDIQLYTKRNPNRSLSFWKSLFDKMFIAHDTWEDHKWRMVSIIWNALTDWKHWFEYEIWNTWIILISYKQL